MGETFTVQTKKVLLKSVYRFRANSECTFRTVFTHSVSVNECMLSIKHKCC